MGGLSSLHCLLGDPNPIGHLVGVAVGRVGRLAGLPGGGGGRRGLVGEVLSDSSQLLGTLVGLDGNVAVNDSPIFGYSFFSDDGGVNWTRTNTYNFLFSLILSQP